MNASVQRAVHILEYLAVAGTPCALSSISRDLQMNKSTIYRFLTTLTQMGYVTREEETRQYRLGAKIAWLAAQFLESLDIRDVARPILEQLAQECGETVHLAILDGFEIMYIDKVEGRQAVRMASFAGSRAPIHSTSVGKVMMAHQPESRWRHYIHEAGLTARTPNTITDEATFVKHLQQVREQGYAIDDVENEMGIRCVAAPIWNHMRQVVAAISITGWNVSMTSERADALIPLVQNASNAVSEKLGYRA
jgi:IclR family KDG regulon transcriptional repressor